MEQITLPFDKHLSTKSLDIKGLRCSYTVPHFSGIIPLSEFYNYEHSMYVLTKYIGVYYLYSENMDIIYIGKSIVSIRTRIGQHLNPSARYRKFDDFLYLMAKKEAYKFFGYSILPKDDIAIAEPLLINHFKPKFNVEFNNGYNSDYVEKMMSDFHDRNKNEDWYNPDFHKRDLMPDPCLRRMG